MATKCKAAVLDDYQNVALTLADWSALSDRVDVEVFNDHVDDEDALVSRLAPFDILCVMRERTPLPARLIERLPNLKLIVSTGPRNASIDTEAASARNIAVMHTGYWATPTVELAWGLILAARRGLVAEANSVRGGGWQVGVGEEISGTTLGILGLGSIGTKVAQIGKAFGMNVIAWSQNLTPEKAAAAGVEAVAKNELFSRSDVLSIHLVLSDRTRGLVRREQLALMGFNSLLVNTSRGPIVDEEALVEVLWAEQIGGAAIDVYEHKPLPADHPLRTLPNVLATPHIGYVSEKLYRRFHEDTVANIDKWVKDREV